MIGKRGLRTAEPLEAVLYSSYASPSLLPRCVWLPGRTFIVHVDDPSGTFVPGFNDMVV